MEPQQAAETDLKEIKISEARAKEAKLAEAKLMSISIAMFMAIVAIWGAVTAYRAALAEQDTLRYERRLQQGEMLELVHRQELLSKASSRTRYENASNLHKPLAVSAEEEARRLAAVDPRQAAVKKLQAEEEGAYLRSLQPYLGYFNVGVSSDSDSEGPISMQTARWLRALGFDTIWKEPAANIWEKLDEDVNQGYRRVLRLAVAVVLFVVALAFLTFAQLSHSQPKREHALVWIGGLIALAGLIFAFKFDPSSWRDLLAFTVGFGILAVIGAPLARRFHFAVKAQAEGGSKGGKARQPGDPLEGEDEEDEPVHPAEVEPALFAGMRLHFAPVAHRFGRFVISMIAVSAVLSALSGFFYSRAAVASSKAMSEALGNQAQLFRLNSRLVTEWNRTVGRMATAEDRHLRYEAARQRLDLAKEQPKLLSQEEATKEKLQRQRLLKQFEESEPEAHKLMTGPLGPEQDINFPWKLVTSQSSHDPAKELARWSAHNELSLGYQREATTFLALLTFFAIALYLLGQALGMGRTSAAFVLVLFACGLVGAGVLRGLYVGLADKPIELRPASSDCLLSKEVPDNDLVELAAEHFARGWVLNESSPDDPADLAKAANEFGCAAQIRPAFAAANLYFALATNSANTPQLNEGGFVSLISRDALDKVSHYEQKAIDVLKQQGFAPTPLLLTDHGFDSYANGLVKADRKQVELGRQTTAIAIKLNDADDLVGRFNLGVAQLAEGHEKEALETYRQAVTLGDKGKEPYVTGDARVIGGAITDLDVFRQYCTGLNDAAYCKRYESTNLPFLKSELVAATWPAAKGRTLANSGIKLTDLHLMGSGGGLGWSGNVENLPPHAPGADPPDTIAVVWYAFSPDWQAWRVLPAISGRVRPEFYEHGQPSISYSVLRASQGRVCLQSGIYRAEFYVDGELADSQKIAVQGENLHPVVFPDLNVAICRPSTWQPWQPSDPDAVWTRGFVENGNHRGAFVFSFFDPGLEEKEAIEERALQRAENVLHAEGLAPAPTTARTLYDCTGLRAHVGELMNAFNDAGGGSIAKAWITTQGLVNVAAVVDKHGDGAGLESQAPSREDCEILLSATTAP